MYVFIAQVILFCSLIGIVVILLRKIPILVELPKTSAPKLHLKEKIFKALKVSQISEKIKESKSSEVYLQKILSKIRILSLKLENKTDNWLRTLREKSKKKKNPKLDNYWEELKKSTNNHRQ